MTTIPHRELRNNSSKILERVKSGEIIDVTNNGEVAATLIAPSSMVEKLIRAGRVRRAAPIAAVDVTQLERVTSEETTSEILLDLRGEPTNNVARSGYRK